MLYYSLQKIEIWLKRTGHCPFSQSTFSLLLMHFGQIIISAQNQVLRTKLNPCNYLFWLSATEGNDDDGRNQKNLFVASNGYIIAVLDWPRRMFEVRKIVSRIFLCFASSFIQCHGFSSSIFLLHPKPTSSIFIWCTGL